MMSSSFLLYFFCRRFLFCNRLSCFCSFTMELERGFRENFRTGSGAIDDSFELSDRLKVRLFSTLLVEGQVRFRIFPMPELVIIVVFVYLLQCGLAAGCQECTSLTPILKHILQHLNISQYHQGYTDLTVSHDGYNQKLSWHFECDSCTYKSFYQEDVISHAKRHHSGKPDHRRPATLSERTVGSLQRGLPLVNSTSSPLPLSPVSMHNSRKRLLDRPLPDSSKRKLCVPATAIAGTCHGSCHPSLQC